MKAPHLRSPVRPTHRRNHKLPGWRRAKIRNGFSRQIFQLRQSVKAPDCRRVPKAMRRLSDKESRRTVRYTTQHAPRPWAYFTRQARATADDGPWNSVVLPLDHWPRCVVMNVAELPMADEDPMIAPAPFVLIVPVDVMLPPLDWLTVPDSAASPHCEQT